MKRLNTFLNGLFEVISMSRIRDTSEVLEERLAHILADAQQAAKAAKYRRQKNIEDPVTEASVFHNYAKVHACFQTW